MKIKKVVLFIATVAIILILNSTNVFAIAPMKIEVYNNTSLIISFIMKLMIFIVFIAYVVFFIVYMIKSKKEEKEKIKKLIKWAIITLIIILILWFGSEEVKKIGMTIRYESNQHFFNDLLYKYKKE